MKFQSILLDQKVTVPPRVALRLTKDQLKRRVSRVKETSEGSGIYTSADALEFKAGETLEIDSEAVSAAMFPRFVFEQKKAKAAVDPEPVTEPEDEPEDEPKPKVSKKTRKKTAKK